MDNSQSEAGKTDSIAANGLCVGWENYLRTPIDLDELERLLADGTPGEWSTIIYDAGDRDHYDHSGPCPSVQAESEDCAIVHWDGFKQEYWSSANGNQRQIEANAALIVALHNSAPAMLTEIRELRAENARLKEAMKGPLAWLERWAVHVGNCETNPECTCGLMFAQHELRAALGEPQ